MADCDAILPLIQPGWTGVEIGVKLGDSSLVFLGRGCTMYLVDPWTDYSESTEVHFAGDHGGDAAYEEVQRRVRPFADRVTILRMMSDRAAPCIPTELDFVFIDGNHRASYVRRDVELYWPKVRSGGLLAGHDYTYVEGICEVRPVVDQFIASNPGTYLEVFSGSWVVRKP